MRPHISYSELSAFATGCQWKWKLDYLENRRSSDYSVDLDFGTAIHSALEAYYRPKNPISLEHAQKLFSKKFAWRYNKHEKFYTKKLTAGEYTSINYAGCAILEYVKSAPELRDLEPLKNEVELFEDIDGLGVKFKGYIDILFKGKDGHGKDIIWVCDFKTCSWGWNREKREDEWRRYQLYLYKHFLCKKLDLKPKQVRVAFILLKKAPSKNSTPVEWFDIPAGPVSVQRAIDALGENLSEMIEREKDNSFKKNRGCCQQYGKNCPYFKSALCE